MEYICFQCKKNVDPEQVDKRIRCPFCGSKIILKKITNIERKVKAL
ncbi:DNA-directed RNA polymerase subunit P [Candidatus Tiddalikarchaeum anstoanum]|nr:DNA-directed RNA polymerase subunit P [Candidatus Tiddalikarchaeum anstoanum]